MELLTIIIILLFVILIILLLYRWQRRIITGAFQPKQKNNIRVKDLTKNPRSRSEAEVVKYLESITGKKFPTVYPGWLKWKGHTLELDGYNEALNIALEFSGPLHTKWFPEQETYPEYFERIVRDVVKRRLCKKYGVNLIVVDVSLPSRHWRSYVISRLFDYNIIETRPPDYIIEQVAKPFRNKQIERELGLSGEMAAAKVL